MACAGVWGSSAFGQTAYFSIQGNLAAVGDKEDFGFNLSRSVSNAEELKFQTFARNGGTNAAGDTIVGGAGGIDSVLQVFDSSNASRGLNDDQVIGSVYDSLLTWTQASGTALNPSPLAAGNYRLNEIAYNNAGTGTYAVDLVGPANALSLASRTPTGTSTLSSLKFGTTGAGASVATFNSGSNLTLTGVLGVGTTGNAALNVTGGTFTVGGVTTVNTNGRINLNGGTFTANNNVVLNAGKLIVNSATFNLGASRTLNANTGAEFKIAGSYALGNGNAVTIQSGSSMSTGSYLDIGNANGNASILVTGAGSSFSTNTLDGAPSFWGRGGNTASVTISSGANANIAAAVDLGSSSTAGTSGSITVNTAGTATFRSLIVGGSTAGIGTVTVDGTNSAISQSGVWLLSVGFSSGTGSGTVNVNNSGTFNASTGGISIAKTGTVNVAGGTLNANGNVTLEGGKLLRDASGTFNLAAGKTLTANNAAQVSFTGAYAINGGKSFTIQSGSSFSTTDFLDVGLTGGNGTLLVTGVGSSLTTAGSQVSGPNWGVNGNTANVTISDHAVANINSGSVVLTSSALAASSSTLNVTTAGSFTAKQLQVGTGAAGTGVANVTGSGSSLTATGTGGVSLSVGGAGASTSTGTINVQDSGTLAASLETFIRKTGNIAIAGGTFNANGNVNLDGGKLLHTSGAFNLAAGKNLTASNGAQVSFGGDQNVGAGSTFTIQSGSSLSAPSTAAFSVGTTTGNGTLLVTGANSSMTIGAPGSNGGAVWGNSGFTSNVTISDGATATINYDALFLASSVFPATSSTLNVTSGAQFNAKRLQVADNNTGTGIANVNGTNSKLSATGYAGVSFEVGGAGTSSGTINVQAGGTLLTGAGALNITVNGAVNNPSGTITAAAVSNNGILASASTTTTGQITGTGTTNVSGGTLTATGGIRQGTLLIGSGPGKAIVAQSAPFPGGDNAAVSRLSTLSIANNGAPLGTRNYFGTFDLANNDLVVDYTAGNGPATLASIRDMIRAAYASGAWTGSGLTSTSAAANTTHALGVADNAVLNRTSFDGLSTNGNQVFVKYTYAGDANLDGKVDIGDLGLLAGAWQQLSGKGWFDGDFTYDGAVNIGDLGLLAGNWQKGTAGNPSGPLMTFNEAMAQFSAFDGVVVPEPTGLALLSLGGLGALVRRSRRTR